VRHDGPPVEQALDPLHHGPSIRRCIQPPGRRHAFRIQCSDFCCIRPRHDLHCLRPRSAGLHIGNDLYTSATTEITTHGPFTGTPTTTGAEQASTTLSSTIAPKPPQQTYYNTNGKLQNPEVIPYQPWGGIGYDATPVYQVKSDHDFESLALGINQELMELDLFHYGLGIYSEEDFIEAGFTKADRDLLEYMAIQEAGHATLVANMLGWEAAPKQCQYDYPFTNVREYIDFMAKMTRWGEAGNWGFMPHLDCRECAGLLTQAEAIEARQFAPGIPQSWHWTFISQYIASCPSNDTRVVWQNFPSLHVVSQPNANRINANLTGAYETTGNRTGDPGIYDEELLGDDNCLKTNETGKSCWPAISQDKYDPLSSPGKNVTFTWDAPGQYVGPNNSYVTSTQAGEPQFAAWLGQFKLTYTPLVKTGSNSGFTYQPNSTVYSGDPALNGTAFVALVDTDELAITPFNISLLNPHVVALGLYQAG
ncbi:protein rds1, partial [Teratosphaeria destructans]